MHPRSGRLPRFRCGFLAFLMLVAATAGAQDAHYWDNQYGTKAQLLGGAVVGSPSDLSATYYNPGWIALGVDASLLVTTFAVEYSDLTFKNALGEGTNPTYSRLGSSPGFLAGRFNALRVEGWLMAWSYIERTRFLYEASALRVDTGMLPTQAGETWFAGEALRRTKTDESWYGFTFSRRIGEHTAFGVTPYLAYRSQDQRIQGTTRYIEGTTQDISVLLVDDFNYSHSRLLAKAGLAFDYDQVKFGVTLTTPGLGLWGSGTVYTNASSSGRDLDGDGVPDELEVANTQDELSASWQSPISIAAGISWRTGSTGLHATAEWFAGIDNQEVLQPEPFLNQTTGEMLQPEYGFKQNAVLNLALGVDHRFNDRFALYFAGRSDWSAIAEDSGSDVLMSSWDLWHVSGGASFQFLGIALTSGLQYSFGNGATERYLDFDDGDATSLADRLGNADVRYRRLKLVVGFDLAHLGGGD